MALAPSWLEVFGASEIVFQAEDELLTIIPKQALGALDLAGWRSPALRPMRRAQVPLWFAVLLKRQDRCSIVVPDWLDGPTLKKYVDAERKDPTRFAPLPWMWQPMSQILLKEASDDIQGSVDEIMQALQDLREVRQTKIRQGIAMVNDNHLKMDGLGAMEINEVKPVLARTMRLLQRIKDSTEEEEVPADGVYA